MSTLSPTAIARAWWQAVDRADFDSAFRLMSPDAVIDWPLSNARMAEPRLWQQVNEHYPGRWAASVQSLVADGDSVVTLTDISDGSINVVAISFFTVHNGQITNLVEYWPEPYAPPEARSQWTVPIATCLSQARK